MSLIELIVGILGSLVFIVLLGMRLNGKGRLVGKPEGSRRG